jgi:hypothetical protein
MADDISGVVNARPGQEAVTACVSENADSWSRMVLMLAVSVRNLGGSLAASPLRTYFVRGLAGPHRELLEQLGAEVVDVDPFPSPIPHANKLRMFQDHAARGPGTLIALDSDIVVLGDLAAEINPDALRGLSGGFSPFDDELWGTWLEARGLSRPSARFRMQRTGRLVPVPYLCSGVLLVPKKFCKALADSWAAQVLALVEAFDAPPGSGAGPALPPDARFFTDQLALTCALVETGIPVDPLPVGCNFRPGLDHLGLTGIGHVHPLKAVHYHRWGLRADGFIKPAQFLPLNADLERVNRLTAAHLGVPYRPVLRPGSPTDMAGLRRAPAAIGRRAVVAVRRTAPVLRERSPWPRSAR